ncbi:hypothetical protein [Labrys monachus]|uniref:Uncharacterized protein n=1 Tax=Labrys monachus TaxID=217067 RepID=A0ABU0FBY2_9HYPH|nr:hypothetical protein [Labrys monachus]MDQ0391832.1 hypothetical protein [Labrys monachus]
MWPFRRKTLLDADAAQWHLDNFAWLARSFPGRARPAGGRPIVPGDGCFVTDGETGHALAERLFEQVQRYGGFAGSGIVLVADDGLPPDGAGPFPIVHGKHAVGTYSWGGRIGTVADNRPRISYASKLLADPQSFIATMAHELAHHLLRAPTAEPPPIDEDEDEHLTDLAAVYLGFGVFLANSAFTMRTLPDGWSYSRQGYLPEQDLVFTTAIHLAVTRSDPAPAKRYLKPHLALMLQTAMDDLKPRSREIAAMRASDPMA